MSYCIANDVPTFAACRGMQMMSIVSGADFIQDIPDYYASKGVSYGDLHRMPADARVKLKETVERIINEGCSGLICIIV